MIPWPARRLRQNIEAQLGKAESVNECVHDTHRILGIDRIVEAFREQSRLIAITPLYEPRHALAPSARLSHSMLRRAHVPTSAFSHGLV